MMLLTSTEPGVLERLVKITVMGRRTLSSRGLMLMLLDADPTKAAKAIRAETKRLPMSDCKTLVSDLEDCTTPEQEAALGTIFWADGRGARWPGFGLSRLSARESTIREKDGGVSRPILRAGASRVVAVTKVQRPVDSRGAMGIIHFQEERDDGRVCGQPAWEEMGRGTAGGTLWSTSDCLGDIWRSRRARASLQAEAGERCRVNSWAASLWEDVG